MRCHLKRVLAYSVLALIFLMLVTTLVDLQRLDTLHGGPTYPPRGVGETKREGPLAPPPPPARYWPSGRNETYDRIPHQLQYVPKEKNSTSKVILVYTGLGRAKRGNQQFINHKCPVTNCILTDDKLKGPHADAVLWQQAVSLPPWRKPTSQVWVMFMLESPEHTPHFQQFRGLVNWTATYRRDSVLVAPYERFVPYDHPKGVARTPGNNRNYAAGKTKKVAWFVSNCGSRNGRLRYVEELQKYIDVDIYGHCGPLQCARHGNGEKCFKMLQSDYKFYLAFENSNCKDYITEKLFWNAYLNDIVPVVMGAHPDDYKLSCPPHSFIHVDNFESPKELAAYLHKLDKDDQLYNQYYKWKGTGSFIDTKFWCRLCSMLHDETRNTWYDDFNEWWRGGSTCVRPEGDKKWATWRTVGKLTFKAAEPLHYGPYDRSPGVVARHTKGLGDLPDDEELSPHEHINLQKKSTLKHKAVSQLKDSLKLKRHGSIVKKAMRLV